MNRRITAPEVRVVGENIPSAVYPIEEALRLAYNAGLDLVLISDKVSPPVCKVIEYAKFKYQEKRKEQLQRKNSPKTVVKELKFTMRTSEHDIAVKQRHAIKFLEQGAKVKVAMQFIGREMRYKEDGQKILCKFAEDLAPYSRLESPVRLEGKRKLVLLLSPIHTKPKPVFHAEN